MSDSSTNWPPLAAYRYGDLLMWKGEWHKVANRTSSKVWLISLERKDATPFLVEGSTFETEAA